MRLDFLFRFKYLCTGFGLGRAGICYDTLFRVLNLTHKQALSVGEAILVHSIFNGHATEKTSVYSEWLLLGQSSFGLDLLF